MTVEKIKYARKMKNDEFYTQRCTIEEELAYWPNLFQNKTVYCNCDTDKSEWEILDLVKPKLLKNGVPIRIFQRLIIKRKKGTGA